MLNLMREAGVTVLVGVPQLFSLFFTNILEKIKSIPLIFRMPLFGLIEIFWQIRKFSGINLSKLALSKIHRPFGQALRFFACGGAKLNEEAARFLMKIGFTILEGYGLTETSPDINGLALQDAMAARQLAIPIVFITGYGDIPMSVKGMKGRSYLMLLRKPS